MPHGTNCNCTPYPPLTASGLSAKSGQTVTAANDAVSGYTTSDVLQQLQSDTAVIDHVRTADAVEIEVGANDVAHSRSCGANAGCYASKIPAIQTNLDAIVGRVHELTSGHKVLVVLLDYWSVWLGGQYAAAQGAAYDETHYLSNDGDHPNAAGHQQIATATEAVIESALHS